MLHFSYIQLVFVLDLKTLNCGTIGTFSPSSSIQTSSRLWCTIPSFADLSMYASSTLPHSALVLRLRRSGSDRARHRTKGLMTSTLLPSNATSASHDGILGAGILDMYYMSEMRVGEGGEVLEGSESRSAVLIIQVGKW